jgi:hypothetical protein
VKRYRISPSALVAFASKTVLRTSRPLAPEHWSRSDRYTGYSQRPCVLRKGDVEIPSDLSGVIYIELDPYEGWTGKLVKELKAAAFEIDTDRIF